MSEKSHSRLSVIVTVFTLILLASVWKETRDFGSQLADFVATVEERTMETEIATAEWVSGGLKIIVRTAQHEGESDTDWAIRHKNRVNAMLVQFPKD